MTQKRFNEVREISIKRFPELAFTNSPKHFAFNVTRLAAVPGLKISDYYGLAKIAVLGAGAIEQDQQVS